MRHVAFVAFGATSPGARIAANLTVPQPDYGTYHIDYVATGELPVPMSLRMACKQLHSDAAPAGQGGSLCGHLTRPCAGQSAGGLPESRP